MLYIGSDHGGFELKEFLVSKLKEIELLFEDIGYYSCDSVDYPDIARQMAGLMLNHKNSQGILICGTGIGISIAANRHRHLRAALCFNEEMARMSKKHNNANVLVLGGRIIGPQTAWSIVDAWFDTNFTDNGRHLRRILKIDEPAKE